MHPPYSPSGQQSAGERQNMTGHEVLVKEEKMIGSFWNR